MPSVEEICRVACIERKWFKAGERSEDGGGPFPSIADHFNCSEVAACLGKRIDRGRIPALEIDIARGPRALCCSLPLCFSWQLLTCPARISARLGVAHIHGPLRR